MTSSFLTFATRASVTVGVPSCLFVFSKTTTSSFLTFVTSRASVSMDAIHLKLFSPCGDERRVLFACLRLMGKTLKDSLDAAVEEGLGGSLLLAVEGLVVFDDWD